MLKKIVSWLLIIFIGGGVLFYFSNKAIGTERQFFCDLLLKNNQHISLLVSRHIIDAMKQVKTQMEGFSRLIVKQQFSEEKLSSYLRYHFERHPFVVGVRYRDITKPQWHSFVNTSSSMVSKAYYLKSEVEQLKAIKGRRDFFTVPYYSKNRAFCSYIQLVRDVRKSKTLGIIEIKLSMEKLFSSSNIIVKGKRQHILLIDQKGKVLFPKEGGWRLNNYEFEQMRTMGLGGFSRGDEDDIELFSFSSFKVMEPVNMPDWYISLVEDQYQLDEFSSRMMWNVYSIMAIGLFCLGFLGKILVFR